MHRIKDIVTQGTEDTLLNGIPITAANFEEVVNYAASLPCSAEEKEAEYADYIAGLMCSEEE